MRTALVLLFLLALAAVPGALLPQRSLNAQKVATYLSEHPQLGKVYDRLGLFEVFASSWFTAIYALLFASLIGCLLPRLAEYVRALRAQPVAAPRNLSRLPHHRSAEIDEGAVDFTARAVAALPRWKTVVRTESGGVTTISAEKGYLRELGNLVFHFSLVGLLSALAVGKIFSYEGSVIVVADGNSGFCNTTPAVYDFFRSGSAGDGTGLAPFCVRVKDFRADYLPTGQASMFRSNIDYQDGAALKTGIWRSYQLKVNDPLRIDGDRIYLTGHGFAPTFTVIYPGGQSRTQTVPFAPDDAVTFLSSGAVKVDPPGGLYPDAVQRRQNQIAIEGLFAPTAQFTGTLLTSNFPAMTDPAVAVDIYQGDTGLDTGRPQNVFQLDRAMIEEGRLLKQARVNMRPGQTVTLPSGITVRFDGAKQFANLQVSHDPAQGWVLVFAITMIAGLLGSLLIKRRRIWARIRDTGAGMHVEFGGLARTDAAGWGTEFTTIIDRLARSNDVNQAKGEGIHADRSRPVDL